MKKNANRLINEKSPYLLMHAYNPVNWYPWSDEAFEKAKGEDKPIFLSIGYSSCHWCHVMEKESFEDEEVAQILNEYFVSIKLDREERPDLDNLYMNACMAINGSGGWPLSCFLDTELKPFFAGTYFPKDDSYGATGFITIFESIADMWMHDREALQKNSDIIFKYIKKQGSHRKEELDSDILDSVFYAFQSEFDSDFGGFGTSPKFPSFHNILFLLRYGILKEKDEAFSMADKTLRCMAQGGIFDHIGGGFSRYSTDRIWLVPHFEKMLYDNAMAIIAYCEAGEVVDDTFKSIACRIIDYCKHEMMDSDGGFYTAQDADSEGVEGKYYLWTVKEIIAALGENDGKKFCELYDITEDGNFTEDKNIPNLIGKDLNISEDSFSKGCFNKLLKNRKMRIPPLKDDKILASGNGLMIVSLSIAGRILKEPKYIRMAEKCAEFIISKLILDNRLMGSYKDGKAAHLATSDDYAYIIWGFIELYESTFKPKWLKHALIFTDRMNELFWDDTDGGYYLSGIDVDDVIIRQKNIYDGALPSGNSIMTLNLIQLSRLTLDFEHEKRANKIITALSGNININPIGYAGILSALAYLEYGGEEIVLTSGDGSETMKEELPAYHPFSSVIILDEKLDEMKEIAPYITEMKPVKGKAAVYICKNGTCKKPITDPEILKEKLKSM